MNLLSLIVCGLCVNGALSILDTKTVSKRHIWRGTPISQAIEEPRYVQTKGGRRNPASLHQHRPLAIQCSPHENGIKSHPYSCHMYITCVDGHVIVDTCSEGLLFNDISKECDFESRVTCSSARVQSARLSSSFQPDSYSDTTQYTDTDRQVIGHFQCPHEGLFEHPYDCSKFIQCAHSGLFVQNCGPGTVFNPSLLVCDWPKNVECGEKLNSNIQSQTPSQKNDFPHNPHNQRGHERRPVDAEYDYDIDVRMTDMNSRSNTNNNNQHYDEQHRVYSTSSIQNEHTQGGYQRNNNTPQSQLTNSQTGRSYPTYPSHRVVETPSQVVVQYPPLTSPQYTPSRTLEPPIPANSQYQPNVNLNQQHLSESSQGRSFQPEPDREDIERILTVQPLANPGVQHNLVHSSPSYAKTKVYSSQQNLNHHQPNYHEQNYYPQQNNRQHSNIFPTHPPNHYQQGSENTYPEPSFNRHSPANRQPQSFDQTMDLLDTYANYETRRRVEGQHREQNGRANVMTVERTHSNRDHEVPIYTRPPRPNSLQFAPRISDDLQDEETQQAVADALKLMLTPYSKSATVKNEDVGMMTSKILSTPSTISAEEDDGEDYEIATEDPDVQNDFDTNSQNWDDHRTSVRATVTPTTPSSDSETLPDSQIIQTKTGRFLPRTNSLPDDDHQSQFKNRNELSYQGEVIELFCSTGFDCGNGVCLSSEKMCDGRDDCGNRLDERHCKNITYDVRLTGDSNRQNIGQIEVKIFDKWGRICGDRIGINEANVFCREAGFPLGAVEVKLNHDYQTGDGDQPNYVLDVLRCSGNETSLNDCESNGWDVHECRPEETVGVICKLPDMKCQLNYWLCDQSEECIPTSFLCDSVRDCSDGSDESSYHCDAPTKYRLGNRRSNGKEGRVEVRYKGIWGTVCDDDFGENEAKVFCRSLGYDGAAAVIKEFAVPGDGLIWLDQVSCIGNESNLEQCTHFEWGENNCNHTEDVSVRCFETTLTERLVLESPNPNSLHLTEMHDNKISDPEHCGKIRVPDYPDDYDDQPVFKVIEGGQAKRGHHPWQATLRVRGQNGKSTHWCGAVLISNTHVLTAAHCLIGFTKNAYFIRLGDHHSDTPEDSEVEVFIEDWYIHEKFRKGHLMNNDIGLIKLKSPIKYTDYIQPVCLPTEETEYTAGKNCTISGWGSIQYGKSTPSLQLHSAHLPIMAEEICKQANMYGSSIQSGMFCAGIPGSMVDACDGDSGGPFVCQEEDENGYHLLYGIISWGHRCGDRNKPGVYTKVSEYLDWINEKMLL